MEVVREEALRSVGHISAKAILRLNHHLLPSVIFFSTFCPNVSMCKSTKASQDLFIYAALTAHYGA